VIVIALQVGRNKPCTLASMTVSPHQGLFLNFLPRKLSRDFKLHGMSILHDSEMAIIVFLGAESHIAYAGSLVLRMLTMGVNHGEGGSGGNVPPEFVLRGRQ